LPLARRRRAVHASSSSSSSFAANASTNDAAAAAETGKDPRTAPFLLTLERSVGARGPAADAPLCATGAFSAEVAPDLPFATTWGGLGRAAERRARGALAALSLSGRGGGGGAPGGERTRELTNPVVGQGDHSAWRVTTVAVQLRSLEELEGRLLSAAGGRLLGPPPPPPPPASRLGGAADALLVLSGSHPLRSIPPLAAAIAGARLDSVDLLRAAARLRDDPQLAGGDSDGGGGGGGGGGSTGAGGGRRRRLPPGLALWAVANPVTERDAARAAAKAAAGAEALLTQPPLDWGAFERWLADARRRGLGGGDGATGAAAAAAGAQGDGGNGGGGGGGSSLPPPAGSARLVVGFPALSSSANARFWLELCGAPRDGPAAAVVREFSAAEARLGGAASADFQGWALEWNRALARRLVGMPGVGGLHVMPVTGAGKRMVLALLAEGSLGGCGGGG